MTFEEWITKLDINVVYNATIKVKSAAETRTLYLSTHGDVYDGIYYEGVLQGVPRMAWSMQEITSGKSMISWGELEINNGEGALDEYIHGPTQWTFNGQDIEIKAGNPNWSINGTVFRGKMKDPEVTDELIWIPIYDGQKRLEAEMPPNEFTSGGNMPDSNVGRPIPLCFGYCYNITPYLIDDTTYTYQLHDGPINDVPAIYDDGVSLSSIPFDTGSSEISVGDTIQEGDSGDTATVYYVNVSSGTWGGGDAAGTLFVTSLTGLFSNNAAIKVGGVQRALVNDPSGTENSQRGYTKDLDNGKFTLVNAPTGQITCDAEGAKVDNGEPLSIFGYKAGDMLKHMLKHYAQPTFTDEEIDLTSFVQLNTDIPWKVGVYIDDKTNVMDVIDKLLIPLLGAYGLTRDGKFRVWRLQAPGTSADVEITERSGQEENFQMEFHKDIFWKATIGYQRNWTKQTAGLGTSVSLVRKEWLKKEYRYANDQDTDIRDFYAGSVEKTIETCLKDKADAETLASRYLELFGEKRIIIQHRINLQLFNSKLGDNIKIKKERCNLDDYFRLIEIDEDSYESETVFRAWG